MRFKEIKPRMVIHCKTEDEANELLKHLESLGYKWCSGKELLQGRTLFDTYKEKTCYLITGFRKVEYSDYDYFKREGYEISEFSDLIIPDQELSAEEALMLRGTICEEKNCRYCPLSNYNNGEGETCNKFLKNHAGKAVELLAKWKSDNEKKEPEIETVDICLIIEILPDWRKRCVHEEDIKSELPFGGDERQKVEEILKKYCMEHDGNFIAVHEAVSRVKAVD